MLKVCGACTEECRPGLFTLLFACLQGASRSLYAFNRLNARKAYKDLNSHKPCLFPLSTSKKFYVSAHLMLLLFFSQVFYKLDDEFLVIFGEWEFKRSTPRSLAPPGVS